MSAVQLKYKKSGIREKTYRMPYGGFGGAVFRAPFMRSRVRFSLLTHVKSSPESRGFSPGAPRFPPIEKVDRVG
jgi:hypothetical protein